jgi:hypothetical protein
MCDYRYYDEYMLLHEEINVKYYCDQIKNGLIIFDTNGVPMVKQGNPKYPSYVYNPTGVANYALIRWNDLMRQTNVLNMQADPRTALTEQLKWLLVNRKDETNMSVWYFNYPLAAHGCRPPWKSAMTQGLILSLLLRIHYLTNDERYTRLAERVANSLKTPTYEGGFLYIDDDGDYWYQEYMGSCGYVLNGFIFALWGVYDYYLYRNDKEYRTIFDGCVDTLRNKLEKYEWRIGISRWTVYDLKGGNPVDLSYQKLHISLLRDLYLITKEKFLLVYANRWESYIRQPNMLLVSITRHARAQVLELFKLLKNDFSPL